MMALEILGALLLLLLVLLLIPVTYSVSFQKWQLAIGIRLFFGLFSKHRDIIFHEEKVEDEKPEEDIEDKSNNRDLHEVAEEPPEEGKIPEEDGDFEEAEMEGPVVEEEGEEEEIPSELDKQEEVSLLAQIRFALDNGLAEELLSAAARLLSHSFPCKYHAEGSLGLGDPMDTGVLCGMFYTLLPEAALSIQWVYTERICTVKGYVRGRIIPLYVLYIALRLAVSKPAREFWHFRQGGNDNG